MSGRNYKLKVDFNTLTRRLEADLRLMKLIESAAVKLCESRIQKIKDYQALARTVMQMANEERGPKLKKVLNETFNGLQAKSSDLMKIVSRMKESIIPSIFSTKGMNLKLKQDVKKSKSTGNSGGHITELKHAWEVYEKARLVNYTNYVKYSANCEMHFSAHSVSNFNRALKILGDVKVYQENEDAFSKWAISEKLAREISKRNSAAKRQRRKPSDDEEIERKYDKMESRLNKREDPDDDNRRGDYGKKKKEKLQKALFGLIQKQKQLEEESNDESGSNESGDSESGDSESGDSESGSEEDSEPEGK